MCRCILAKAQDEIPGERGIGSNFWTVCGNPIHPGLLTNGEIMDPRLQSGCHDEKGHFIAFSGKPDI